MEELLLAGCLWLGRRIAARLPRKHPYGGTDGIIALWLFLFVMAGVPILIVIGAHITGHLPMDPALNRD